MEESTRLLLDRGAVKIQRLEQDASDSLRQRVADLGWSPDTLPLLGIKVNLPPSELSQLTIALLERNIPQGSPGLVTDAGFGTTQLLWWPESDSAGAAGYDSRILETIGLVRELARELGGSAAVEHVPTSVKEQIDIWGQTSIPSATLLNTGELIKAGKNIIYSSFLFNNILHSENALFSY